VLAHLPDVGMRDELAFGGAREDQGTHPVLGLDLVEEPV
jgi:hypothetical protein